MPSSSEFQSKLDQIPGLIEDIGDDVVGSLEESSGIAVGDEDTEGYWCRHGEHNFTVFSKPNREYFTILYFKSIMGSLASRLGDDAVDELLSGYSEEEIDNRLDQLGVAQMIKPKDLPEDLLEDFDIDIEPEEFKELDEFPEESKDYFLDGRSMIAAIELIQSIDSAQMERLKDRLRESLSDPNVAFTLHLEGNAVHGFDVSRKVFVYEDNFSLQELSNSVQAVVSIGVLGNNILANSLGGLVSAESPEIME